MIDYKVKYLKYKKKYIKFKGGNNNIIYGVPDPNKPGWVTYPVLQEPYNRELSPMCKKQINEDINRLENNNELENNNQSNRNIILISCGSIIAVIIAIIINMSK